MHKTCLKWERVDMILKEAGYSRKKESQNKSEKQVYFCHTGEFREQT